MTKIEMCRPIILTVMGHLNETDITILANMLIELTSLTINECINTLPKKGSDIFIPMFMRLVKIYNESNIEWRNLDYRKIRLLFLQYCEENYTNFSEEEAIYSFIDKFHNDYIS